MISNAVQLIIFLLAVKGSLSDDSLKVSKMLLQDQATILWISKMTFLGIDIDNDFIFMLLLHREERNMEILL